MEIFVLGTSNCLGPHSVVTKMMDAGLRVRNLSLGACTSTMGLYLLDQIPKVDRGIALIDYSINDADAGWNLWGTARAPHIVGGNIRTIASRLSAMNYIPVVVIMPSNLDSDFELLGEQLHRDICLDEKINFINLRQLFRSAAAGVSLSTLMRDGGHMSDAAARQVARFFAEIVAQVYGGEWSSDARSTPVFRARTIEAAQIFGANAMVKRESSIRSAFYGRLNLGETIRIPVQDTERLAGILINTGAKGGTVVIEGSNAEITKSLTVYWHEDHPEWYGALLVDVAGPILGGPSGVTMTVAPADRAPTERTLHGRPVLPNRYGEVEIEGVVVLERDCAAFEYLKLTCTQWPLDLGMTEAAKRLRDSLAKLQ
jgi:hypothetical protein